MLPVKPCAPRERLLLIGQAMGMLHELATDLWVEYQPLDEIRPPPWEL